jgi:hypothetical protein
MKRTIKTVTEARTYFVLVCIQSKNIGFHCDIFVSVHKVFEDASPMNYPHLSPHPLPWDLMPTSPSSTFMSVFWIWTSLT